MSSSSLLFLSNSVITEHTTLVDVTAEGYRAAVRSGSELQFVCQDCKVGTPSPNISFDVADISFRRDGSGVEETLTGAAVGRECKCKTAKIDRHIKRAKVPGNESSIEL